MLITLCRCSTAHQLTPVPEDSASSTADGDRHGNRCQGNGVAISVARSRSLTTPRPPPPTAVKRSCLRQTTAGGAASSTSDLELPRSPRRPDVQRLPARLRVAGGENTSGVAATTQDNNDNGNRNDNDDDNDGDATATTINYDTEHLGAADPSLFPLGVRLTTV